MNKFLFGLSSLLALVGVGVGIWTVKRPDDRRLEIVGGRATISLLPSMLDSNSLRLILKDTAEGDSTSGEASSGFRIGKSDLKFHLMDGHLSSFETGAVMVDGGFKIISGRNALDATRFQVSASNRMADGLQLKVGSGKTAFVAFELSSPRVIFDFKMQQLVVSGMDMILTAQGAQALGRPDLGDKLFGTLSLFGDSSAIDGGGEVEDPGTGGVGPAGDSINVAISNMSSLTALGRTGTFPNGINGLSMLTTSCNVGNQNIPWNAPMQTTHPVISMNLYRVLNGRFEQVGWSWMKHGFLATNSNGCGTCQNPGTGSLLGPNCSDTYGTGNNGDRFYLGERKEINPFTGVWTCEGSWFSNYQPDCIRRNTGSGLNGVAHRLAVLDSDLGNANATYYYEGYYINANDTDHYNNIANRTASMSWGGSSWNIQTTDTQQTQGPAINRWGDIRGTAQPNSEGDVIVAVKTTSLGGGMHHYEYAVYNHDLDRQIREFSIPLPAGIVLQNIGFRDIDQDSNNQWTSTVAGGSITWSTSTFGSSSANPLMFSSVFNFRFDANVPPADGTASMTLFKPGTGTTLAAATKSPLVLQAVSSFQLVNAIQKGGNLQSLAISDNDRLSLSPDPQGFRFGSGITASLTAPSTTVNSITVGVESNNTLQASANCMQKVELWNWITNAWDQIDNRPTTQTDSLMFVSVSSNASRYVNPQNREVLARILHTNGLGDSGNRWTMSLDQVGMSIN